jgi:hypothetical protein
VYVPFGSEGIPSVSGDWGRENKREILLGHWLVFPAIGDHCLSHLEALGGFLGGHEEDDGLAVGDWAGEDVTVYSRRLVLVAVGVLQAILAAWTC